MSESIFESGPGNVVPSGTLHYLKLNQISPSSNNPRHLFDREPLESLKASIREHGVLVPITAYQPKGQTTYSILDGERRYRCCVELKEEENRDFDIPANVVDPPSKMAALLYMFSIHNFREQWELMPTALALKTILSELKEDDNKTISKLTGLSEPQINRCKKILAFPIKFQQLSLDPNSKTRIPSNFWIEAYPVLNLCEIELPELVKKLTRDGITENLVEKYRAKNIKSVIHFRRIMDAYEFSLENGDQKKAVLNDLENYILDVSLETRKVFDPYVTDTKRAITAVAACDVFIGQLTRLNLDYTLERGEIRAALEKVMSFAKEIMIKLEGGDPPTPVEED